MNLDNYRYTENDEWIKFDDDIATIGITDYAQGELGDLVFVNLPEVGDKVFAGEPFSDVESVKAIADVMSPVTGIVIEVNENILEDASLINQDPYENWFIKVNNITDEENLITIDEYRKNLNIS